MENFEDIFHIITSYFLQCFFLIYLSFFLIPWNKLLRWIIKVFRVLLRKIYFLLWDLIFSRIKEMIIKKHFVIKIQNFWKRTLWTDWKCSFSSKQRIQKLYGRPSLYASGDLDYFWPQCYPEIYSVWINCFWSVLKDFTIIMYIKKFYYKNF